MNLSNSEIVRAVVTAEDGRIQTTDWYANGDSKLVEHMLKLVKGQKKKYTVTWQVKGLNLNSDAPPPTSVVTE